MSVIQHRHHLSDFEPQEINIFMALAAVGDRAELMRTLIEQRADPNASQDTIRSYIDSKRGRQLRRALAHHGVDVDIGDIDESMRTPLHYASLNGHAATARVLVELGVDPNALTTEGQTAVSLAARHGHEAAVRALVELKSDLALGAEWRSPLMCAIHEGDDAMLRTLIELKADPNGGWREPAPDTPSRDYPSTPMISAIAGGHEMIVHTLVQSGYDMARDMKYYCPSYHAKRSRQLTLIPTLRVLCAEFGGTNVDRDDFKATAFMSPLRRLVLGRRLGFRVALPSLVDTVILRLVRDRVAGRAACRDDPSLPFHLRDHLARQLSDCVLSASLLVEHPRASHHWR